MDGDRIYALGQDGDLVCIDAAGKRVWHRNLVKDFGGVSRRLGLLRVAAGGRRPAGLHARRQGRHDGRPRQEDRRGHLEVRHPGRAHRGRLLVGRRRRGRRREAVRAADQRRPGRRRRTDGKFLWKYEKLGPNTANIPTPIVLGDHVFASAGYGKGGALLKLKADGKTA